MSVILKGFSTHHTLVLLSLRIVTCLKPKTDLWGTNDLPVSSKLGLLWSTQLWEWGGRNLQFSDGPFPNLNENVAMAMDAITTHCDCCHCIWLIYTPPAECLLCWLLHRRRLSGDIGLSTLQGAGANCENTVLPQYFFALRIFNDCNHLSIIQVLTC